MHTRRVTRAAVHGMGWALGLGALGACPCCGTALCGNNLVGAGLLGLVMAFQRYRTSKGTAPLDPAPKSSDPEPGGTHV